MNLFASHGIHIYLNAVPLEHLFLNAVSLEHLFYHHHYICL